MNAILIYLITAIILYVFVKTRCVIRGEVDGEEVNSATIEIVLIIMCLFWIISIPLLFMIGRIKFG